MHAPHPVPSPKGGSPGPFPRSPWSWLILTAVVMGMACALAREASSIRLYQDDFLFLYEASRVQSPADLLAFTHASRDRFPRPMITAFFWAAWHAWGLQRAPYHHASLGLHALAAMLLAVVISTWQRPRDDISWPPCTLAGATAALFFAAAPCHAEVLCWPAAVEKEIQACLALACLACWLQAGRSNDRAWLAAAWTCFVAALLTEEWAVVLPGFLLLADCVPHGSHGGGRREFLVRHAPFWCAVAVVAGIALLGASLHPGLAFALEASRNVDAVANVVSGTVETVFGPGATQASDRILVATLPCVGDRGGRAAFAVAWLLLVAWAWRAEKRLAFWLLWVPLAWVPYAVFVPNSPAAARYTYIPCLGVAAAAAVLVQASSSRVGRAVLLTLLASWVFWNAHQLARAVHQVAEARSGPQRELAEIPRCLARLGPAGTAWVYCPPLKAHFTSHAAGLVGELPPYRIGDWYEALRQGQTRQGDVLLYYDEGTGDWADLTATVAATMSSGGGDRDRLEVADRVVALWDSSHHAQAWRPLPSSGETPPLLVSPPLHLAPSRFYAVRVVVHANSPLAPGSVMTLGWRAIDGGTLDPSCTVTQPLAPRSGVQEVTLFPATRLGFWTGGEVARLFLAPGHAPGTTIHVRSIELLEFPPRVHLPR